MTKRKRILIIFIIALIPKLLISLTLYPYNVYDEFGSMASAAYVAGCDWSSVLSESAAYYGFGYYIFYAPIFMITDNPYIIYKVIVCGNAILQASCSIIAYEIMGRVFPQISYRQKAVFSVMLSYLMNVTTIAMNETPAFFIVWMSALLSIIIIQTSDRKRGLYAFALILDLVWGLTIHTRLILLLIIFIGFSILYKIIWKEKFLSIIHYLLLVVLYFLSKRIIHIVQGKMWLADSVDSLTNASIDTVGYLSRFDFLDISIWKVFVEILIGQIGTATIFSAGLFIIGVFATFSYIIQIMKWKKLNKEKSKMVLLLFGIYGACIGVTIAGQMITWGYQALTAINNNEKGVETYKVFTYIRYFAPYMGPFVLCAIGIMYTYNWILRRIMPCIILFIASLECIWMDKILPYVEDVNMAGEEFMMFANRKYAERIDYTYAFVWLGIYLIIFIFSVYKNKIEWYVYAVFLMLFVNFSYKVDSNNAYALEKTKEVVCCYEFMQLIENNISLGQINIYEKGIDNLRLQFYLNRYPIHNINKFDSSPDNLIFCKGVWNEELVEKLIKEDYCWYYVQLDEETRVLVCEDIANEIAVKTNLLLKELE